MLESKNIFIDTQYYVKTGLNFENSSFKKFKSLCHEGNLIHITTSVVKGEVYGKVHSVVDEALNIIKDFKRKRHVLTAIDENLNCTIFDNLDTKKMYTSAGAVFDDFLKSCKTNIIDSSKVNTEDILKLYFEQTPPFSAKKKAEFPDAISLLSLKSELEADEKLYIVSDDNDMIQYCALDSQLISMPSLEKILDLYNEHEAVLTVQIKKYVLDFDDLLKKNITTNFDECEVFNNSSWEDAEVEYSGLTSIGSIDPNIISITDDWCQISFDVEINFLVEVIGPDFNNSVYDKEDGHHCVFEKVSRSEYVNKTFTIELELIYTLEEGNIKNIKVDTILIVDSIKGIEVCIEENADFDF